LNKFEKLDNLKIFAIYKKKFQAFTKPSGCNNVQKSKKLTLELFFDEKLFN